MPALSQAQVARRRHTLGASEVAAAVGLSRFKTPLELWVQKTTGAVSEEQPRTEAGHRFEEVIANWYAELEGAELVTPPTLVHPSEPWISCTPDRLWTNAKRATQIKLVGVNMWHEWDGDNFADGGQSWWRYAIDGAPKLERIQVEWEMLVLEQTHGIAEIDLVAMTGTDLRVYRLQPDLELRAMLLVEARKFWGCVERDEPPPVDGSESWKDFLNRRFPHNVRVELDPMPDDVEQAARAYLKASEIAERAEKAKAQRRNEICRAIGDGSGFIGRGIKTTWKCDRNGQRALRVKEF